MLGFDLSKHRLDIAVLREKQAGQVENTSKGINELVQWMQELQPELTVVEAPGGYHRSIVDTLFHTVAAHWVGRFLPFAIYSQTDSPQECRSNEKYHETKLFSSQRDHQGLHIQLAANSAQAKWLLEWNFRAAMRPLSWQKKH